MTLFSVENNAGTLLFTLERSGDDMVINNVGGNTYTFINAYLYLEEESWTFIGVSVGI